MTSHAAPAYDPSQVLSELLYRSGSLSDLVWDPVTDPTCADPAVVDPPAHAAVWTAAVIDPYLVALYSTVWAVGFLQAICSHKDKRFSAAMVRSGLSIDAGGGAVWRSLCARNEMTLSRYPMASFNLQLLRLPRQCLAHSFCRRTGSSLELCTATWGLFCGFSA